MALGETWGALRHRWAFASAATFLYWFAAHELRPLVTLRLDDLGASDAFIGATVAAYPFFSLFLAIPGGRLVDRLGVVRVLVVSLAGMAVVGVAYALATSPLQILLIQIANGVVELGVWLALQALVTHSGSGRFLRAQLALFSLAWGVGIAVGPIVGAAVFDLAGFQVLGWIYAGCALAALVCGVAVPYRGREEAEAGAPGSGPLLGGVRVILARPAVLAVLASTFVALYIQSLRLSFYPLFLEREGIPVSQIGVLLSVMGVSSLAIRFPLPALLERFGPERVLLWSMWLAVAAVALTPWLDFVWALGLAAIAIGIGYGVNPPVTVELIAKDTEPAERGLAMGIRVTSNRLAQIVQPLVFGAFASALGMAAAFPASGVLLGALVAWVARESRRASRSPGEAVSS